MRVLHVASEVAPYSQSGGLAQVAGALPQAIAAHSKGTRVAVLTPLYREVLDRELPLTDTGHRFRQRISGSDYSGRIVCTADSSTFFVDCPPLYDRRGLYGDTSGEPWPDNPIRFALLARVALELGDAIIGGAVDVYHAHDWQAGLVPVLARAAATPAKTVFTIHNLAFQGVFDKRYVPALGLDWSMFTLDGFEFWDQLSFLKGGAAFADAITTVSPTYASEIKREESGHGLASFFRQHEARLTGILNGLDTRVWNPATDPLLPANYSAADMRGKARCRDALCEHFRIEVAPDRMLCGVVSRLAEQKGPDLIAEIVPALAELGAALVVLGSGDRSIEARLEAAAARHPRELSVIIGFDERLSHEVFAGADALLMPSRFEPCGLAQLSAMRYGAIPIASPVGGLADTITDSADAGAANGFLMDEVSAGGLRRAATRAAQRFHGDKQRWRQTVETAMATDWSWTPAAAAYLVLYRRLSAS